MVTITTHAPARSRVSLRELIEARDASLSVGGVSVAARLKRAWRGVLRGGRSALGYCVLLLTALTAGLMRHGLVLAGLGLFVGAAAQFSLTAALITGGVAAFFLEARRR
jgi:hypothetical protein